MVLDWLKKLSGAPTGKPRDNGTDRNAVIKRVVAGAAEDTKKAELAESGTATAVADLPPAEPAKPTPPPAIVITTTPVSLPKDKIAQRAFEIWVRKGRPFGTSDLDWLQAEQELQRELQGQPGEPLPNKPR